jgi:hypothetical protein
MHALVAYAFELAVLGIGIYLLLASIERQTEVKTRDSFSDSLQEGSREQLETAKELLPTNPLGTHTSNRVDDRQIDHPVGRPSHSPFEIRAHLG